MASRNGITKTSVRLQPEVKAAIRRAAAAEGCSMNRWMVRELDRRTSEMEARKGSAPGGDGVKR